MYRCVYLIFPHKDENVHTCMWVYAIFSPYYVRTLGSLLGQLEAFLGEIGGEE